MVREAVLGRREGIAGAGSGVLARGRAFWICSLARRCDDVLILTGALLLEEDHTRPAVERFTRAFRSAFTTMLTTSVTTAARVNPVAFCVASRNSSTA